MVEFDANLAATVVPLAGMATLILLASLRSPSVHRAVAIIRSDGFIERHTVTKKTYVLENGSWFYSINKVRYAAIGPEFKFHFRLVRSLGLRKYVGLQRIYIEGNPTPLDPRTLEAQVALLRDAGRRLGNAVDSDLPTKLLRPRKVDLLLILLGSALAFFVGLSVGMYNGSR